MLVAVIIAMSVVYTNDDDSSSSFQVDTSFNPFADTEQAFCTVDFVASSGLNQRQHYARLEIGTVADGETLSCGSVSSINNATAAALGVSPSQVLLVAEQVAEPATRRLVGRKTQQSGRRRRLLQLIFTLNLQAAESIAASIDSATAAAVQESLQLAATGAGIPAATAEFSVQIPDTIGTISGAPSSSPSVSPVR